MHLWFARRPLAASRAVVFASLVYDPDHPDCPADFRAAVERHLKSDVTEQAFDDMRLVVQVGGDAEEALGVARGRGLFMVDGPTCRLALLADRLDRPHLGEDDESPLIDQLHRAMFRWQRGDRAALVPYLHTHDLADHAGYWRLAQALFEVLPRDSDDWRLASALLAERPTLRTEIKLREAALTPARERMLFEEM